MAERYLVKRKEVDAASITDPVVAAGRGFAGTAFPAVSSIRSFQSHELGSSLTNTVFLHYCKETELIGLQVHTNQ